MENVLFASGSHFGSKADLNCCIEIMMKLLTAAERKSVSVTDLDASSQSTSMDGSYAGSEEIRADIGTAVACATADSMLKTGQKVAHGVGKLDCRVFRFSPGIGAPFTEF